MKNKTLMVLAGLFVLGVSNVYAEPAAVIDDLFCVFPTPEGSAATEASHTVVTNSKTGVVVLKCKGDIEGYDQGQWSSQGFVCGIATNEDGGGAVFTTDSQVVISNSGNAMMTCKYKMDATP